MAKQLKTQQPANPDSLSLRRKQLGVAATFVGSFMALLDVSIVNVALASMQQGLHATSTQLGWVVSGYATAFGLALILAGRLGDAQGRKKLFILGLVVFVIASALCGSATSPTLLIAFRVLQGIGAGIYLPQISATIQALFQGKPRAKALSALGAVIGIATALGPVVGGILLRTFGDETGWRWVFLVNIPVGIIGVVGAFLFLPETRNSEMARRTLDPIGIILLTATSMLVLVPLQEGRDAGWPMWVWVCLALSLVGLAAFFFWERRMSRRGEIPLLPESLMKNRSFYRGCLLSLTYFASFASLFFAFSLMWQAGFHHSPLHSGLTILPYSLGAFGMSLINSSITNKLNQRTMTLGLLTSGIGYALIGIVIHAGGANISSWVLFVPFFIAGAASALVIAPNQRFVLAHVPVKIAGVGAAVMQTGQRIGTAVGIAASTSVFFAHIGHGSPGTFIHAFEMALAVNLAALLVSFVISLFVPPLPEGH